MSNQSHDHAGDEPECPGQLALFGEPEPEPDTPDAEEND